MIVAKKLSQVATHMAVAFGLMYALTGSLAFSGLAVIIEPLINVALLPFHERVWQRLHSRLPPQYAVAAERTSQAGLHFVVAFGVVLAFTGSLAFGGVAAVLEPILNVVILPVHDRLWDSAIARSALQGVRASAA
ncbi:DUF2061 domain-containing protein [Duganella sp. BuS-21]|uniref:DUF2061 domain-containing protein n=1 Tax=Duganella sp. BuS-21 TaxID=2943848 RepID=UPI0035A6C9DE